MGHFLLCCGHDSSFSNDILFELIKTEQCTYVKVKNWMTWNRIDSRVEPKKLKTENIQVAVIKRQIS